MIFRRRLPRRRPPSNEPTRAISRIRQRVVPLITNAIDCSVELRQRFGLQLAGSGFSHILKKCTATARARQVLWSVVKSD